jgi:hypothetical protein
MSSFDSAKNATGVHVIMPLLDYDNLPNFRKMLITFAAAKSKNVVDTITAGQDYPPPMKPPAQAPPNAWQEYRVVEGKHRDYSNKRTEVCMKVYHPTSKVESITMLKPQS